MEVSLSEARTVHRDGVMFQFNMGKKFGGYSWLRSADSTRRRLEYFLANKWQRDGEMLERVSCEETTFSISGDQRCCTSVRVRGYLGADQRVQNTGITNIELNFQCKMSTWLPQLTKYE